MVGPADLVENRLDLDRVDVPDSTGQGGRDVVARARADDHRLAERRPARVAVEQVRQHVSPGRLLDPGHHLVADVVGYQGPVPWAVLDLVVRRPDRDQLHAVAVCNQGQHRQTAPIAAVTWTADHRLRNRKRSAADSPYHATGGMRNSDIRPNPTIPARLPSTLAVYADTRLGIALIRPAHLLPEPHERQGDEQEERPRDRLDRHHERARVVRAVLGAEEHLLRRPLPADVDQHLAEDPVQERRQPRQHDRG